MGGKGAENQEIEEEKWRFGKEKREKRS